MSTTAKPQSQTKPEQETKQPWLWNVVLLNDDDHTYDYVIAMMKELFAHPEPKGMVIAGKVDRDGRAVVLTTHKELAELKQEQIHAYGRDKAMAECAGAMSAVLEPAEFEGDSDDKNKGAE